MFMENNTGSRPAAPASNGAQTTQASCPDHNGTLPSCAGLAVPYVPFQQDAPQKYSQSEALSNGTLFPGLNLPFHLAVDGSALPATPLAELQALEFVILELGLYLDTHKDDTEAFNMSPNTAPSPCRAPPLATATVGCPTPGPGILGRMR